MRGAILCSFVLVAMVLMATDCGQVNAGPFFGRQGVDSIHEETRPEYGNDTHNPGPEEQRRFRVKWNEGPVGYYDWDATNDKMVPTDRLGPLRRLGIQGTLMIESPDGQSVHPLHWVQGVRVVVARTPGARPDWSKGHDKRDSAWCDCVLENDGSFLATFPPDGIRRPIGGIGTFQIALCLGTKSGMTFTWRNSEPILPQSLGRIQIKGPIRLSSTLQAINGAPSLDQRNWNPVMLVRAVNHLQSLGRVKAVAELQEFRKVARDSFIVKRDPADIDTSDYESVRLILRLLFESDKQLGRADQERDVSLWPVFPVAVQDDLPFLLAGGDVIKMGRPSDPMAYLGRGSFLKLRAKPLRPTDDPIAAVDKLLALPQLQTPAVSEVSRTMLRRQAWKTIAHLVHAPMGNNDYDDPTWEERKKVAAKLNVRWDVEKQDYVAGHAPGKSNGQ